MMLHFGRTPWRSYRSHRPVLTCRRLKRITRRGVRCPAPRALYCASNKSFNKRAHKLCFDNQEIKNEFFFNFVIFNSFNYANPTSAQEIRHSNLLYITKSIHYVITKTLKKANIAEKPPRSRNFVLKYKKLMLYFISKLVM